jgi:hypothetical protein
MKLSGRMWIPRKIFPRCCIGCRYKISSTMCTPVDITLSNCFELHSCCCFPDCNSGCGQEQSVWNNDEAQEAIALLV